MRRPRLLLVLLALTLITAALVAVDVMPRRASHDRDWNALQARLPIVRTDGDHVRIRDIRDFRHYPDGSFDEHWIDGEYDVARLRRVWFALSPFNPRFRGVAHPFLTFEFADGRTLAISVEARRQTGVEYSPLLGLARRYETMVVIGTEEDLLSLRVIGWDDPLYLFPVRVTRLQAQHLFRRLLADAQAIEQTPVWYNTITNNCTTPVVAAINDLAADDSRLGSLVGLLPGYSLDAAWKRGWIDTDLPFDEMRRAHYANDRVAAAIGTPDFSKAIRTRPDHR